MGRLGFLYQLIIIILLFAKIEGLIMREMGKVKDIYFDDHSWVIRYVQIDAHKWLPAKNVYVSPSSFKGVNKDDGLVEVNHTKGEIKSSPTIPSNSEISTANEASLTEYYGWNRYWMGGNLWGA